MILQKHKSIRPNPGVKRIQNYIFKFSDFLGKGNFSSVYKGTNELTNQTVAIKYIALNSLTCERLKELLDQQIQIFTSLNHPNIVKCYEVLKSAHNCYIITQLCDGGDLQTLLKKKRLFTQEEAIPYIRDIFEGLYYLSKKNIIHRDVKLANIFINNNKPKIADFGFAQRAKKEFNDGKIGTPLCMSPEGFLENLYGCKTDVWAFGIILYQMTHGRLHLDHCTTEQMLKQQIRVQMKIQQLKPQLSLDLKQLILRCLDVNPCTRISFQQMKSHPFIRKIISTRDHTFSLQDIKYIPSFHNNLKTEADESLISLKSIQHPHFDHLQTKQKIKIAEHHEHMNFQYGSNRICQDLKPLNVNQIKQKTQKCICRPPQIKIPTISYIPINKNKKLTENSPQITMQNSIDENQQYQIRISHKSSTQLTNDQSQSFTPTQQKSLISTTDRDFLEVPSPISVPFRKHKGSFDMTSNEEKLFQNLQQRGLPKMTARKSFQVQPSSTTNLNSNKPSKMPIDVCPITNTKRYLKGFIKFNEAIGLIHYCRLIYKYILELKSTGIYHVGDLNLRYYSNYLLNLLNQLNSKAVTDHIILSKGTLNQEGKQNKLSKMQKVIEQYIQRYKPNIQKQRADYLNRTTQQIKQIVELDKKFIDTFYIPDKTKIQNYNAYLTKFTQALQRANRFQRYSQFDSNKQLESCTKQQRNNGKQESDKKQNKNSNENNSQKKSPIGRYEAKSARIFV